MVVNLLYQTAIVTAFYKFATIHCNMTEEEKAEVIAILAIDVQRCLQEYKEKLLWLVHGNHYIKKNFFGSYMAITKILPFPRLRKQDCK